MDISDKALLNIPDPIQKLAKLKKELGHLMTSYIRIMHQSWDTSSALTFPILNSSKTALPGPICMI